MLEGNFAVHTWLCLIWKKNGIYPIPKQDIRNLIHKEAKGNTKEHQIEMQTSSLNSLQNFQVFSPLK